MNTLHSTYAIWPCMSYSMDILDKYNRDLVPHHLGKAKRVGPAAHISRRSLPLTSKALQAPKGPKERSARGLGSQDFVDAAGLQVQSSFGRKIHQKGS